MTASSREAMLGRRRAAAPAERRGLATGHNGGEPTAGGDGAGARRPSDGLACGQCKRSLPAAELDRMLWCGPCTAAAKATASRTGWLAGACLAGTLALWIVLVAQPSRIVLGGWIGAVLATWWLGGRIGRELCFGALRYRGRPR